MDGYNDILHRRHTIKFVAQDNYDAQGNQIPIGVGDEFVEAKLERGKGFRQGGAYFYFVKDCAYWDKPGHKWEDIGESRTLDMFKDFNIEQTVRGYVLHAIEESKKRK